MQIWAFILVAYFAGVFLVRKDFADLILTHEGAIWAVIAGATVIIGALANVLHTYLTRLSEKRHHYGYGLVALACIGSLEFINSNISTSESIPHSASLASTAVEVDINRAWDGHFRAIAKINSVDVGMMVDTGASLVLLRQDDAVRAGLPVADLDYSVPLTTANGKSMIADVQIDELRVGDIILRDVRAGVAQDGALHSSLLGMSFLENISETVIQKDRMTLRYLTQ